jgi:hypothetical protein
LKKLGDDGAQGSAKAVVHVPMGWAEIRAVYSLHTQLGVARTSRDEWKRKCSRIGADLERSRADIQDHDLLNNRAVVSLLVDVERILAGTEDSETAVHETRKRVKKLVARARKTDRRRGTRA